MKLTFKVLILLSASLVFSKECGKGIGSCPKGECCSKYGYCGTGNEYCVISNGCQDKYGNCITNEIKYPASRNGRCGEKFKSSCPEGECCSKKGYCGTTTNHCFFSKGCQTEFGECYETGDPVVNYEVSTDGRCGPKVGKACPDGECCSKKGYCGTTINHCFYSKGCQTEFGDCNETGDAAIDYEVSTNGKCGPKVERKCPEGECCSKYGYCGKSSSYCGKGCQSEFGKCKKI